MRIMPCAAFAVAATLWAGTTGAQSAQYTAPGDDAGAEPVTKEEIERRMEDARWRLGPVRIAPYFGVRNLAWVENVFADEEGGGASDLTASLGAGLTAYLPTGPRLFWVAQAMPEYVYWADLAERRELVGRYGAGVYADLNRLTFAAAANRIEEQAEISSEEPEPALAELDRVSAEAALRLTSRLSLTAGGSLAEIANRPGDPGDPRSAAFELLDRREERARAGLRFATREVVEFEAGVERHETDFADAARDLSTTGTSPYLSLGLAGNRIELDADVVRRSFDPEPGSLLPPVETTEGTVRLGLTPGWRFEVGLYGRRSLLYSFSGLYTHFDETRYGAELSAPFGSRFSARAFVEAGENDYGAAAGAPPRLDDALAFGAVGTYQFREWLRYDFGYRRLELDSNLPGFDRDTESVLSTLSLTTGSWIWQ